VGSIDLLLTLVWLRRVWNGLKAVIEAHLDEASTCARSSSEEASSSTPSGPRPLKRCDFHDGGHDVMVSLELVTLISVHSLNLGQASFYFISKSVN
jgi:hypothetical protein